MKLTEIRRHPVKSLQGESVTHTCLEDDGLFGDRAFGIVDLATGKILTGRREPALLLASARLDADDLPVIVLPGGDRVAPGKAGDAALSRWIGRPVHLAAARDTERVQAESFVEPLDEAGELRQWELPAGRFVDTAPVLLVTTATFRAGEALYPEGDWDIRRFRPNLVVDAPGSEWLEDAWPGSVLALGDVELTVRKPCSRCIVVTRTQPGIVRDLEIFRTLAREHSSIFGVLCDVRRTGALSVGDELQLLEPADTST